MSSTSTTRLGLFKPTPCSGEPFRTSDVNSNMDKIDAEAVAVDARLDVVEPDVITAKSQLAGIAAASANVRESRVPVAQSVSARLRDR